ncbi:MAG: hypothetical protein HOD63_15800 [Bacteroidetes bacterium]|jgi:hypothetical protein|nr:hypothetical protein [Bacteroidota bacterium]MBT5531011.1 hypothetical protein [Cytophagia bacterium]MBT3423800.1 hypothetical protein [Bacteroidota bacterium]MBT3801983.1 hypothetical protein [Bacteroidota bacterium]MBT3933460.1 hypothetical protein [Bacteroidota bacterium]
MNKQEADTIIKACNKHKINAYIRKEGDLYLVNFMERFEYRVFKAAQYMCNSLVLEYKIRKAMVEENRETYLKGLNFSNKPSQRKQSFKPGNWADRHMNKNGSSVD